MQKVGTIQKSGIHNIELDKEEEYVEEAETKRKIGGISLQEEIGRGAFAIVYKGKDHMGREVAVKEIARSRMSEKLLGSLRKETAILKSLQHENIVKLLNVITTAKFFYLVMEYCNGGDLNKHLKKHKRFEEHVVQNIIYQVSQGLKELYDNHIIHRDLKLSNFLLMIKNGTYTVKIADFGFATVLANGQDAETFCGTAPNMAPEVLTGYFAMNSLIGVSIMRRLICGQWGQ